MTKIIRKGMEEGYWRFYWMGSISISGFSSSVSISIFWFDFLQCFPPYFCFVHLLSEALFFKLFIYKSKEITKCFQEWTKFWVFLGFGLVLNNLLKSSKFRTFLLILRIVFFLSFSITVQGKDSMNIYNKLQFGRWDRDFTFRLLEIILLN